MKKVFGLIFAWLLWTVSAVAQIAFGSNGGVPIPPITTGTQYYPAWPNANIANSIVAPAQNAARCSPFWLSVAYHADQIAIIVTTAGTGPLNFAIYSDAVDATRLRHQPQTLLTDPSLAFNVTSAANVTVSLGTSGVGIAIPQGLNWICVNDTTGSDVVRYAQVAATMSTMSGLVGSSAPGQVTSVSQFAGLNTAVTAGTTTANWPSFVGTVFTDLNTPYVPNIAFRVTSVP